MWRSFLLVFTVVYCESTSAFVVQPSSTQRSSSFCRHGKTSTAIMGIKGFRSWLEQQFPASIVDMPIDQASDQFDHVLIDMNQLLHIVLRKSRSDGHGLTLLMKELDACLELATPTKSLVLAMDGPPSAAKLATQRKRRFSNVIKTDYKIKQIDKLLSNPSPRYKPKQLARKKRRAAAETRTLCITPATDFMFKAEQALLYWVWQRLSSRNSSLSTNNVKVFISPSTVAGEGEVKLLEWIYNKKSRKGESIAILGGDSDLVLEGLVIPMASTHNVFVLLPEGNKRILSVSLWEITRSLNRMLPHVAVDNVMKTRTDLTLLLIMNGNDYLPKLRGSSGFNKLFHTYLRIQRSWHSDGKPDPYLVHPDTLEFNVEFCLDFFSRLAALAPTSLWSKNRKGSSVETERTSHLQQLNNLVASGYLPGPVVFSVIRDEDSPDDEDRSDSVVDDSLDDDSEDEDQVLVRLTLGEPGTEDSNAYELWRPKKFSLKAARRMLASMALSDLIDADSEEEDSDEEDGLNGIAHVGYDWEIRIAVEGKTEDYLYGLLWNIQTYQDGTCADYAFNYGKRLSPTAKDFVNFFEKAKKDGKVVGLRSLSSGRFNPPVSAGVSCLAALPSAVKHLVPSPYRQLDDESVETIYGLCMSKDDNIFDIKKFERLCDEQIMSNAGQQLQHLSRELNEEHEGRRILMGDHYWTVISKVAKALKHPFDPPAPFSDRLSKLRPNNRIRVSRAMASVAPRPRYAWNGHQAPHPHKEGFVNKNPEEVIHSDPGDYMRRYESIKDVQYMTAFASLKKKKRKGLRKGKIKLSLSGAGATYDAGCRKNNSAASTESYNIDIAKRLRAFNIDPPPAELPVTKDGVTGMACLKQLHDAGLIGSMSWKTQKPSDTDYASFDPKGHESVELLVGRGKALQHDLTYMQDRPVKYTSRQLMKQHLASTALRDIVGSERWSSLSFKEIKGLLTSRSTNIE